MPNLSSATHAQIEGVYSTPPVELAAIPDHAVQFSPLIPGAAELDAQGEASLASMAMLAPAGTIERRYMLARSLRALSPGGALTALAPKHLGGTRLAAELKDFGCDVIETAKRHHRICHCMRPASLTGVAEALAAGRPQLVEDLGLWSQPGVFSWNRIDPGSALLLAHLPAFAGRGADFGCGIGVLAHAVLASHKVAELTLIDIDRRAIDAARRNVDDVRARFSWSDIRRDAIGVAGLDFIVMNPPFHDGGAEDRSLGQSFIKRAAETLRTGGRLWLTANRHLPYEAVLKPLFRRITPHAQSGGFKIYEAQK